MGIVWEQRIWHVDRPIKRRNRRYAAKWLREDARRETKGLPSRNIDGELVFARLRLQMAIRVGETGDPEIARQLARVDFEVLRRRLLERKRKVLARVRARKVTEDKTCINLWRRRRYPPRQNTCRPHRTMNPGAQRERVGSIPRSIQGPRGSTHAAAGERPAGGGGA